MINWPILEWYLYVWNKAIMLFIWQGVKVPRSDQVTLQGFVTESCVFSFISKKHKMLRQSQKCWN